MGRGQADLTVDPATDPSYSSVLLGLTDEPQEIAPRHNEPVQRCDRGDVQVVCLYVVVKIHGGLGGVAGGCAPGAGGVNTSASIKIFSVGRYAMSMPSA